MTIDLPAPVADNIARFTGRAWLLPALLEWWDRGQQRLFLLTGGPGTGKSMVAAWLAGYGPPPEDLLAQAQLARLRGACKAAYFCGASSRNISPRAFAEGMATQLTAGVAGFGDALAATLADRVQINAIQTIGTVTPGAAVTNIAIGRLDLGSLGDELSFDRAFVLPLKRLYASGFAEPMLLLVDALDEAQTYTGVTLPDLLSRLSDLPAQVRLLTTTRQDPRVLKFFHDIKPLDLIRDAPPDLDDVRDYAAQRLLAFEPLDAAKRTGFAVRLARQANGVFLYAALVLDELLAGAPGALPDLAAYPLPDGLSGLYRTFLNRELGRDEQRWFALYEPLLGLIAVARGEGLTAAQLTAIIGGDIRAALRATKQYLSGDLPDGPFRPFHKSFADFLLEDQDNLDCHIDAVTMHQRIAQHYWTRWEAGTEPADGLAGIDDYGLEHLAAHLAFAQWPDRLHALLDERWARIKEGRQGSLSGFLGDVGLAWQWAESRHRIDLQVRYALFEASAHSLAGNLPLSLLAALLRQRQWTPTQGLSQVERISDSDQRAAAITILAESLTPALVEPAVALVRAIGHEAYRIIPLAALIPLATGALRDDLVAEVTAALGRLEYASDQAAKLCRIAGWLTPAGLAEALRIALAIRFEDDRARALTGLIPHLPASSLARVKKSLWALASDQAVPDSVAGLAAVARRSSGAEQLACWQRAVDLACGAKDHVAMAQGLAPLAPDLPAALLPQVLAAIRAMRSSRGQAELVAAYLPRCPAALRPALLTTGMQAVDRLGGGTDPLRVGLRVAFLPSLASDDAQRVFTVALAEARDGGYCNVVGTALALLIPHAPVPLRDELQAEAMRELARPDALIALAECLPPPALPRLFEIAVALRHESDRTEAIGGMAPYLPPALIQQALSLVSTTADDEHRLRLLDALAPWLAPELLPTAVGIARAIRDAGEAATALAALAGQSRPDRQSPVSPRPADPVAARVATLPRIEEDQVLAAAWAMADPGSRALALARLLPRLRPDLQAGIAQEALAACTAVVLPSVRMEILVQLAPRLRADARWQEVFWDAYARSYAHDRARALLGMVPLLPAPDRPDHLAGAIVQGAAWVWDLDPRRGARDRAQAWSGLLEEWRRLDPAAAQWVWSQGLHALAQRSRPDLLLDLAFLAPILGHLGGAQAVAGVMRQVEEVRRVWP